MDKRMVLYEYEQILLGKKKSFSSTYFPYNPEQNERLALEVFRHAVEVYLNWSPTEVQMYLNGDVIKQMKLDSIVRYLRFPLELDPKKDYFYIAHLLYPNIIHYNAKELILNVYKRVLNGTLCKFPQDYMAGTRGFMCAAICFQYMLERFMQFSCIEDLYAFFASPEGSRALKKYRLSAICNLMFGSPLDYLHESLNSKQKNEFLYRYHKFSGANANQIKRLKKNNSYIL